MRKIPPFSQNDINLWKQAVQDAKPLHPFPKNQEKDSPEIPLPSASHKNITTLSPPPPFSSPPHTATTKKLPPLIADDLRHMDKRTAERLRKGIYKSEATLDLHGHTQENAYISLCQFLHKQAAKQHRCVCVITGQGKHGGGVLRGRFSDWLNEPEIRPLILGYCQAQPSQGGKGAWYVLLKK